jgi:hypothetical protein
LGSILFLKYVRVFKQGLGLNPETKFAYILTFSPFSSPKTTKLPNINQNVLRDMGSFLLITQTWSVLSSEQLALRPALND